MPHPRLTTTAVPTVFHVRDALLAGATRSSLRHPTLTAPHYGVRSTDVGPVDGASSRERLVHAAAQFLPRLRVCESISHTSALRLYGCPIRAEFVLHVISPPGTARNRSLGVHGHRASRPFASAKIEGIPVVEPAAAVLQSAEFLTVRELVVAIDHLVLPRGPNGRELPLLDPDNFVAVAHGFHGRGARALQRASELSRSGSESRMETLTRLMLHTHGLADLFELQVVLNDAAGRIGRFDLVAMAQKVVVEFDGDQHRTSRVQYEKDLWRLDRAREAGFRVFRLLRGDVLDRPFTTASRIAAALNTSTAFSPRMHALLA